MSLGETGIHINFLGAEDLPPAAELSPNTNTTFLFGKNQIAVRQIASNGIQSIGIAKNEVYIPKREVMSQLSKMQLEEAIITDQLEIESYPPTLNIMLFRGNGFSEPNDQYIFDSFSNKVSLPAEHHPQVFLWELGNQTVHYQNALAYLKSKLTGKYIPPNSPGPKRFPTGTLYTINESGDSYETVSTVQFDPARTVIGLRYNPELMRSLTMLMDRTSLSPALYLHLKPKLDELTRQIITSINE